MIVYSTILRSRRGDYQPVDAHSVLLCVIEALTECLAASMIPGLHSLSLA